MSICRSLQLRNGANIYTNSRGCLPCFWVIPPWKEARSWIPEKEQSLQTTGQSLSAVLLSPLCLLCLLLRWFIPGGGVVLSCLSFRVPHLFSQHALWLQPTCEIWNLYGIANERTGAFPQLQSHLPKGCIDLRCLTNYEGKHQNLGCPHTLFIILGFDRLVSATEHIGGQICRPGSGATARVLLLFFFFF